MLWGGWFAANRLLVTDTSDCNLVLLLCQRFLLEIPAVDWGDLLSMAVGLLLWKPQKWQTCGFWSLAFLSHVSHMCVVLTCYRGYVLRGWWLSGKMLGHYRRWGPFKRSQALELWTRREVLLTAWVLSCHSVSRTGALANNQAGVISTNAIVALLVLCCQRRLFTGNASA